MSKYKYNKKALKGLGIKLFLNEVKERENHIADAKPKEIKATFNANKLAIQLHPHYQILKIVDIKDLGVGKEYTFKANKEAGTHNLATFRASQFLSIIIDMPDRIINRTYCIISSPKEALGDDGFYKIFVAKVPNGFSCKYIHENWKIGDTVVSSGPIGDSYFNPLRDSKDVIAIAGTLTPFISMAKAIRDGIENFNLTILHNTMNEKTIIYKNELEEIAKNSNGKIKFICYLMKDENPNYEYGMITSDIIKQYMNSKDCSIFADYPKMMQFLDIAINEVNLPKRRIIKLPPGPYGEPSINSKYPKEAKDKEFTITVLAHGEKNKIQCKYNETLIEACHKLKLHVTTDCRSGLCGWCHSRLIQGDVFIPEEQDGRREADKKFGWIHPCVTYPLSDVTIEVFPNY